MNPLSPFPSYGLFKVLTVSILSFALLTAPLASAAAASSVGAASYASTKPETKNQTKTSSPAANESIDQRLFVNAPPAAAAEALPQPVPAPLTEASSVVPLLPAGAVTATMAAVLTTTANNGDGKADPGDTITYTVQLGNTTGTDATGVTFSDTIDSHTTLVNGSLNSTPIAFDQSFPNDPSKPFLEDSKPTDPPNANFTSCTITLKGQDPDGNLPSTAFSIVTNPTNGTLGTVSSATCAADGTCTATVTYTPNANYFGSDSFTFKVNDGTANSNQNGTVSITVTGVNDPPTFTQAGGSPPTADHNPPASNEDAGAQTVSSFVTNISAGPNESGQTVSFIVTGNTNPSLFSSAPAIDSTGKLTYTAAPNQNGTATITYHAHDNGGTANGGVDNSSDQQFVITVNAVNDPPVVVAPTGLTAQANMKITGLTGLLSNVTDADTGVNGCNPSFTVTNVSATSPAGGTISNLNASTGTFDFDPPPGVTGNVTFTYTVTDNGCPGTATSSPATTVTINVQGPVIWFVNPALSSNGNGTLSSPFNSLASALDSTHLGNHGANQRVFVYSGTTASGVGVSLDGSSTQAAAQWLVGQGAIGTNFDTVMGISPPTGTMTRPSVGGTRPTIQGTVTMKDNTVVEGLNIDVHTTSNKGLTNGTVGSGSVMAISDVNVTSSTGNAVDFSAAQTVNYTSSNSSSTNVLVSTTGRALNLANTTIGSNGMTFKSISANGGNNGIVLDTTSGGTLTVTGDGTGQANGSGGTIQNITGSVLGNAPLYAKKVSGTITLKSMNMSLDASSSTSSAYSGMYVDNNLGGTVTVNVTGCVFTGRAFTLADTTQNKALLQFEGGNTGGSAAHITANVQDCFFNGGRTYGLYADGAGDSTMNVTLNQSGFGTDVNTGNPVNKPGTTISSNPPPFSVGIFNGSNALVDYMITNNTFWGANGTVGGAVHAVAIGGSGATSASHNNGTFSGNKIGKTGVTGSGCAQGCAGLGILPGAAGTYTATITNNDIRQTNSIAINIQNTVGAGVTATLNLHIKGNTIAEPDTTGSPAFQRAIAIIPGNSGGANVTTCVEFGGSVAGDKNNISGAWQASNFIRLSNSNNSGTMTLQGLSPTSGATAAQVNSYVEGNNNITGTANTPTTCANSTGCDVNATPPINGGASCPLFLGLGGVWPSLDSFGLTSTFDLAQLLATDHAIASQNNLSSTPDADYSGSEVAPYRFAPTNLVTTSLNQEQLDSIVVAAIERWSATGLTQQQIATLRSIKFEIANLSGSYLGEAEGNRILIDRSAGGNGWYVGSNPLDDSDFAHAISSTRLYTDPQSAPAGHLDLLTAIMHEMGHQLKLDDTYSATDRDNLMYGYLTAGERRLPTRGQAKFAQLSALTSPHFLSLSPDSEQQKELLYNMASVVPLLPLPSGEQVVVQGKGSGFTLPSGKTVTITFQVTLNNPPNLSGVPPATPKVSTRGTLQGSFGTIQTVDSNTGAATETLVDLFNTTSTITGASPSNSTNTGQAVTFTASIAANNTPAPAGGTLPSGTATFKDNGTNIAGCVNVTVNSGSAQCTTSALTTGVHNNITVAYSGDGNFDPSTSAAFTQTVTQSGTTVTVSSSLNPSLVTQNVTFTATVASTGGNSGPPTGTVTFKDNSNAITCSNGNTTTETLSSGVATCQIATLSAGNHSITAVYGGDTNFTGNTGTLTGDPQVVNKSNTTMTLGTSGSPTTPGTTVTFTATINSATTVTAARTGTVTFYDGTAQAGHEITACGASGVVTVSSNQAQCATNSLSEATHTITAVYSGDATYNGVTNTVQQVVAKNGSSTAIESSKNPSAPADSVTFTATVTSSSSPVTVGSVTFKKDNVNITSPNCVGLTPDSNGKAQCTLASNTLSDGSYTIKADFTDASNTFSASSASLTQQVTSCASTAIVTSTADDGSAGTLRDAISKVCDGGTITFNLPAGPQTITLASELQISKNVTITGPGTSTLNVSGNNASRVFNIGAGKTVSISGMTITQGKAPDGTNNTGGVAGGAGGAGGAIYNNGALTLSSVVVSNSRAGNGGTSDTAAGGKGGSGGGIYNISGAMLYIVDSTISGNWTGTGGTGGAAGQGGAGGGIYSEGGLNINRSTLNGNKALGSGSQGGGIASNVDVLTINNSTISGNTSDGDGGGLFNGGTSAANLTSVTITANRSDNDDDGTGDGGGTQQTSSNALTLFNTIVAGNFKGNAAGIKQSETITVTGTATVNGNIIVRVTAAGMNNSPKDISVAVSNGESASMVANDIVAALTADSDVGAFFNVSIGSNPQNVVLTVKTAAANDSTMHVKIFGNATGIQNADSSPTTAGVAPTAGTKQIETLNLTGTTIATCSDGMAGSTGTISVTVTANGMSGSGNPMTVSVANGDDASAVATKIRDFLATNDPQAQNVAAFFDIGVTGANVTFTKKTAQANDATLQVSVTADSPCNGIIAVSEDTQAGVAPTSGTPQQETVTVSGGPVISDGTIQVTVTAAGMTGSPETVPVIVTAGDSNTTVAGKIATALNNDTIVGGFFTASNSGANVTLTANVAAANDPTMHVKIFGNATGIQNADSSPTTAGLFQVASDISGTGTVGGSFNLIGTGGSGGLTNGASNNQVGVADAKFDPAGLQNNGGQTQTIALQSTSTAVDNGNAVLTTLSASVADAVTTTVTVADASKIPAGVNFFILIENEQMIVLSKSGNQLTVTRGASGTTAAAHTTTGVNVSSIKDQRGFPRPFNFDGAPPSAGDDSDIGAFEKQSPPAAPATLTLQAGSDTGASQTDHITKVNTPTFDVTGVTVGASVELLRDTSPTTDSSPVVASITASSTNISLTDNSAPADGTYYYSVRQKLGGDTSSLTNLTPAPNTVTIDTTPATPAMPDLQDASDTGASNTDNITSASAAGSRKFDIGSTESGATVELLRDTVPTSGSPVVVATASGNGGTVTNFTDGDTLPDGVYAYTARQTDIAGNVATSSALNVTIDATAPAAPSAPDLQSASDSGASQTDNITNVAAPVFDIGNTENGAFVELLRDTVPTSGAPTVVASGTASGASITLTDNTSPAEGQYAYTARQTDGAGNSTMSASALNVTIDRTAPTPAVPDLQAGSDTGASQTDNVTNAAAANSRSFDITGTENGATIELLRVTVPSGGNPPVVIASTTGNNGTVTLKDPDTLTDGSYSYTTRETDLAGNVGTSGGLTVVIDTVAPAAPATPDLQDASDTGASHTDNITSNAAGGSRIFDMSFTPEADSTVELLRNGAPVANGSGASLPLQLADPNALPDGTYDYTARHTDLAGNSTTSASVLKVTIDTTAPSVNSIARLNPAGTTTNNQSVDFAVTFSEAVTGVDITDFAVTTTGGITYPQAFNPVTNVAQVDSSHYTVTVDTGNGDGTVRLDFINNNSVKDAVNLSPTANFTTGEVYTVSKSDPFVSSITRANSTPTSAASVDFTVTFSKPVTGVNIGANSDFTLTKTGGITGESITNLSGSGSIYTVTVNTGSGNGTLRLDVVDDNSIIDSGNRPLGGPTAGDGNFNTGEVYTIDKTPPTVSVAKASGQADPVTGPTASTVINFTVTFNKSVTGFDSSDVAISGTAGATVANVSQIAPNDGTTYNVGVEGMTQSGSVTITIPANAAFDSAGNGNTSVNPANTATVTFNKDNSTTFVVNTTADTDDGSCDPLDPNDATKNCTLREAINAANADAGAETITFNIPTTDSGYNAGTGVYTISLGSALPDISSDMTIQGLGANVLTVKRNSGAATRFRIFTINSGNTVQISGLTISGGRTLDGAPGVSGGGIQNSGTLTLTGVAVSGNQTGKGANCANCTGGDGGSGGGIANNGTGTLTITNSTVSGNQTGVGGDGVAANGVGGSGGSGGGISNDGTLIITNSTISGNQTGVRGTGNLGNGNGGSGGGIANNGTLTIANSTITSNTASTGGTGGGIRRSGGTITLKSTIIGGNSAGASPDIDGSVQSDGFNLIKSTSGATINQNMNAGPNITGQDPQLKPLADNGGPTQTHALQCTSPAIDNGKAFGQTTDQRGLTRVFDLADSVYPNAAGGDGTDIGAYESQSGGGCVPVAIAPNPQPSTNEDNTVTIIMTGTFSQNTPLTFTITQQPSQGSLSNQTAPNCNFDGGTSTQTCTAAIDYKPNANFNGADLFKFKVSAPVGGGTLDSEEAEVDITINAVNDAPVATAQNLTTDEDTSLDITLTGTDVDSAALTFSTTNPSHGMLSALNTTCQSSGNCTATLTYTPNANYNGSDQFTYKANDGSADSNVATISINVHSIADTPGVTPATTNVNKQTTSGLVISRSNVDGNEIGSFKITNIQNGTLFKTNGTTQIVNGQFITAGEGGAGLKFTPDNNLSSPGTTFSFDVQAANNGAGDGISPVATATITVNKSDTKTALSSSATPAAFTNQTITFTATVTSLTSVTGPPTGTVQFFDGANPLTCSNGNTSTETLDGTGQAQCQTSSLDSASSPHSITAVYSGDLAFSTSTSNALSQAITPPLTLTVNDTGDTPDNNIGDGICADTNGKCTLRAAIQEANAVPSDETINFNLSANSTITLNTALPNITGNLVINGPGANTLTVQRSTAGGTPQFGIFTINSGKTVSISGLTISNGNASIGGGIYNQGTLTLTGCAISGNSVNGTNTSGGGIASGTTSGTAILTITNSTISGNSANGGSNSGGGIINTTGNGTATLTITNSTISGNSVNALNDFGGGIYNSALGGTATVTITNSTISGNSANNAGGGIYIAGSGTVTAKLSNTIVAGNTKSNGTTPDDIFGTVDPTSSFNLIGTGGSGGLSNGTNNNQVGVADARLAALAFNGGTTQTMALLPGSPALDAGSNTLATNAGLTTDQRGTAFNRIVDSSDADTTATVDIGAFEAQPSIDAITDKTTNEDTPLSFNFGVADGGVTGFTVSATSSNQQLVPDANITLGGSGSTRSLSITPAANEFGTATISVTVSGTIGSTTVSMTSSFKLTVNAVNDPPVANNDTLSDVLEDSGQRTIPFSTLLANDSTGPANESNQSLTIIAVGNAVGGSVQINGTNVLFTTAADYNGPASFQYTVQDNGTSNGNPDPKTATATASFNIIAVNDAPTLDAITDRTILEDASQQTVNLTGITAGGGESQTLTVSASSNNTALIPNPTVSYSSPNNTGSLSFTPVANQNGSAVITVTIKDNGGTSNGGVDTTTRTFTVNVTAVNDAPSFTKGADQTVSEDAAAQTVNNWATNISKGPANESSQTLNFIVSNNNNNLFSAQPAVSPTGTLTYTPAANAFGTATVTVALHDDGGTANGGVDTSASQTFTITVNPVADTPSVTPATTTINTQTTSGLVISRNAADSTEVTNFKITNITNGTLFKSNGTTPINNNDFITFSEGNAGLKFTPANNLSSPSSTFSFQVQASLSSTDAGLGGSTVTASITVNCTNGLVVTNTNDSGIGSLRDAINKACPGATITFNLSGGANTITLTSGELVIVKDLTITGPGVNSLTVSGNNASRVFNIQSGSTVSISDLTIANGKVNGNGGGILNQSTLTLTNCNLYGNSADSGGAIFNNGQALTLNNCNVGGTQAGQPNTAGAGGGGGIFNNVFNTGTLNITNSSISGNTALAAGGGIGVVGVSSGNSLSITITNSTISGNNAGGIFLSGSSPITSTITNSTISGNKAQNGGGVFNAAPGAMTLTNATITGNRSSIATPDVGSGGGLGVQGGAVVTLRNTIVAGNFKNASPSTTADDINGTVSSTSSFNLIGTGGSGGLTDGTNNNQVGVADARLAPLGNYGGTTQTHALLPGSPAINAGSNALAKDQNNNALTTDQRGTGFNRVVNTTVDIGAFESRGFTIASTSGTPQSAVITNAFALPLVATVSSAFGEPTSGGIVTFTAPSSGASGTFTGNSTATVTLNASGVATSPTFTANNLAGSYNVTATANGIASSASFSLTNSKGTTSTALASSVNPSDSGQSVTFSATVTSAVGTPTGTVQFKDNGSNMGSPVTLSNGVATFTTSSLTIGTHTITADYNGDANFLGSSGTLSGGQVVKSQLSIGDVSLAEGNSGTTSFNFPVTLSQASTVTVKVDFATSDGTAKAGSDYVATSGTVTFSPGETSKTVTVLVNGDTTNETDENFFVTLSNPVNGTITRAQATGTIKNDDGPPTLSINDVTKQEGNSGTTDFTFTVTLSSVSGQTVTVNFATADGTATVADNDYQSTSGTVTFNPGETSKQITVKVVGDTKAEPDENFFVNLSNSQNASITRAQGTGTILSDDTPLVQFSASSYTVLESGLHATIIVNRLGDLSKPATVDYATSDPSGLNNCSQVTGNASQRCDYAIAVGTLRFAANESSKTIFVPIINDVYVEGPEFFTITLSNPVGAELGSIPSARVNITDDDNGGAINPITDDAFFIRQLYIDFLDREPETAGLQGWLDILHNTSGQCKLPTDCDRLAVALGFVRSPEFQDRGYFIFRFYSTALGRNPSYFEFMADMARVSGFLNSADLEANKSAFVDQFMSRQEFRNLYDSTLNDPAGYVDKLLRTVGIPDHPSRSTWIVGLGNGTLTRQQVLRQLVESTEVYTKFYNQALIVMQYFAFLRRDPDAAYLQWIDIFNHSDDYRILVNGFINSPEYPIRFGP